MNLHQRSMSKLVWGFTCTFDSLILLSKYCRSGSDLYIPRFVINEIGILVYPSLSLGIIENYSRLRFLIFNKKPLFLKRVHANNRKKGELPFPL